MRFSIYQSIERELENAIDELLPEPPPQLSLVPDPVPITADNPITRLTRMSYLFKFSPGNYFSHLFPDTDFLDKILNT